MLLYGLLAVLTLHAMSNKKHSKQLTPKVGGAVGKIWTFHAVFKDPAYRGICIAPIDRRSYKAHVHRVLLKSPSYMGLPKAPAGRRLWEAPL